MVALRGGTGAWGTFQITGTDSTTANLYVTGWSLNTSANGTATWDIQALARGDSDWSPRLPRRLQLEAGREHDIELPDGSVLRLDAAGNYRIDDSAARVVYQANRRRGFNRYVNASDILEDFIRYVGSLGVRRRELPELPIRLLIQYLILQAAAQDGEPPPAEPVPLSAAVLKALPAPARRWVRCRDCGRFIPRRRPLEFCAERCLDRFVGRTAAFA